MTETVKRRRRRRAAPRHRRVHYDWHKITTVAVAAALLAMGSWLVNARDTINGIPGAHDTIQRIVDQNRVQDSVKIAGLQMKMHDVQDLKDFALRFELRFDHLLEEVQEIKDLIEQL